MIMKNILTIAIAAAALLSFSSCQKEELNNTDINSTSTERIISGSFVNDGTKTTLDTDAITPLWSVGDMIRVLDGTSYQDFTLIANGSTAGTNEGVISADGKSFTFTTTLTGETLYAVYPASATAMKSCTDGNVTFTIPSVQDGTFGSANICVASGDGSNANTIYFRNATAVVEMTVPNDVVGTKFVSTNNIAGSMTVAVGNYGAITGTTPSLSSSAISVSDTKAPAGSKFYLAVAAVETGAVNITCNTISLSGSTGKSTKTLAMDKIYAMDLSGMTIDNDFDLTGQHGVLNGQEYVLIKAKYDGNKNSYLKWSTQNLAVTESGKAKWKGTNYVIGDYFQWAASYNGYNIPADSQKPDSLFIYTSFVNNFTTTNNSFTFKTDKNFKKNYAPYGGASYTKYTSTDSKTVLDLSDDVAYIVLGSTWRIPTGGENGQFNAMTDVTYWAWDDTDKGYYVFKPGVGTLVTVKGCGDIALTDDKTKALLFFPATGNGYNSNLRYSTEYGYYMSRTLESDGSAFCMLIQNVLVNPKSTRNRYYGIPVRPVSE